MDDRPPRRLPRRAPRRLHRDPPYRPRGALGGRPRPPRARPQGRPHVRGVTPAHRGGGGRGTGEVEGGVSPAAAAPPGRGRFTVWGGGSLSPWFMFYALFHVTSLLSGVVVTVVKWWCYWHTQPLHVSRFFFVRLFRVLLFASCPGLRAVAVGRLARLFHSRHPPPFCSPFLRVVHHLCRFCRTWTNTYRRGVWMGAPQRRRGVPRGALARLANRRPLGKE